MADRALFIGWGQVVRGREHEALANFNETLGLYGRAQQDGRIESFDVCLLDPHGGDLGGFIMVHGTADQLNAFRDSDDFRANMAKGSLIVDRIGAVGGAVGEGVARQMGYFNGAVEAITGKAVATA
jgi:hypothetical protein